MLIKKLFNHNALLAENEAGHEVILLGRGIGFGKKVNDHVDADKIQKRYVFETEQLSRQDQEFFKDIPIKHIELGRTIFNMAQEQMKIKLDHNVLVGLTDHISYAIQRYENNQLLKNVLLWDIKKFYPLEFKLGMMSLDVIYYDTNIQMEEDEAGFIAMHFVNAVQNNSSLEHTARIAQMVDDILQIVEYHFQIKLDQSITAVLRFVTHIRFFGRRLFSKEIYSHGDGQLYETLKYQYPNIYRCVLKIEKYLMNNFNVAISEDEFAYFMLHIKNVYYKYGSETHE